MPKLLPYETIVKAHAGDPEAVEAVLSHYAGYIRHFSKCELCKQVPLNHILG